MNNRIDITDEALRIFYLESAKEADNVQTEQEINHILSFDMGSGMNADRKDDLLGRLKSVLVDLSLGQMIQHKMEQKKISDEALANNTSLPVEMVREIIEDKVYANNIPVMILKDLLNSLKIPFENAERAIRKTFNILQQQNAERNNYSAFNPSFRKSVYISKDMVSDLSPKIDGKELFENKIALDKYLNRLSELLEK